MMEEVFVSCLFDLTEKGWDNVYILRVGVFGQFFRSTGKDFWMIFGGGCMVNFFKSTGKDF